MENTAVLHRVYKSRSIKAIKNHAMFFIPQTRIQNNEKLARYLLYHIYGFTVFYVQLKTLRRFIMQLEDMRNNLDLINSLDWEMTPEKAVCIYLEWGTCWSMNGTYPRWARDEETHYFVINTWNRPAIIHLVRRNKDEYDELATIKIPAELEQKFLDSIGYNKGVYGLEGEVKTWLQNQLDIN